MAVNLVGRNAPFRGLSVKLNAQDNAPLLQDEGFVRIVKGGSSRLIWAASSMYICSLIWCDRYKECSVGTGSLLGCEDLRHVGRPHRGSHIEQGRSDLGRLIGLIFSEEGKPLDFDYDKFECALMIKLRQVRIITIVIEEISDWTW